MKQKPPKLRVLGQIQRRVCQGTVDTLRDVLRKAEAGDVVGVAIATGHSNGNIGSAFNIGDSDVPHLVYAVQQLNLRLLDHKE